MVDTTQDSLQTLDRGQAASVWGPGQDGRVEVVPMREQLEALVTLGPGVSPQGTTKIPMEVPGPANLIYKSDGFMFNIASFG